MRGQWKNNKSLTYGSNGADGSEAAKFIFTDSFDLNARSYSWKDTSPSQKVALLNFQSTNFPAQGALIYDVAIYSVQSNSKNTKQNTDNCLRIINAYQTLKGFSSVQNVSVNTPDFKLFPNPLKAGENLSVLSSSDLTGTISIMGLDGKKYFEVRLDLNNQTIILPPDLISGLYVLQFETLNTTLTKKLVINP